MAGIFLVQRDMMMRRKEAAHAQQSTEGKFMPAWHSCFTTTSTIVMSVGLHSSWKARAQYPPSYVILHAFPQINVLELLFRIKPFRVWELIPEPNCRGSGWESYLWFACSQWEMLLVGIRHPKALAWISLSHQQWVTESGIGQWKGLEKWEDQHKAWVNNKFQRCSCARFYIPLAPWPMPECFSLDLRIKKQRLECFKWIKNIKGPNRKQPQLLREFSGRKSFSNDDRKWQSGSHVGQVARQGGFSLYRVMLTAMSSQ